MKISKIVVIAPICEPILIKRYISIAGTKIIAKKIINLISEHSEIDFEMGGVEIDFNSLNHLIKIVYSLFLLI